MFPEFRGFLNPKSSEMLHFFFCVVLVEIPRPPGICSSGSSQFCVSPNQASGRGLKLFDRGTSEKKVVHLSIVARIIVVFGLTHTMAGWVVRTNCLRSHFSSEILSELLVLGARKFLRIWCIPFFFTHLYFLASGQAVATGVIRSSPRFLPSFFFARRV